MKGNRKAAPKTPTTTVTAPAAVTAPASKPAASKPQAVVYDESPRRQDPFGASPSTVITRLDGEELPPRDPPTGGTASTSTARTLLNSLTGLVRNFTGRVAVPQPFTGPTSSAPAVRLANRSMGPTNQSHFYGPFSKSMAAAFVAGSIPRVRKILALVTASMVAAKALFKPKH